MEKILGWFYSGVLVYVAMLEHNMKAAVMACVLAIVLVGIDFITGCWASLHNGVHIKSKRLRQSITKTVVYILFVVFTLLIGVLFEQMDREISLSADRGQIIINTLIFVKYEAYMIAWIELVSCLENLNKIYPKNRFIQYVHYILAVEFVHYIPKLSDYLNLNNETRNIDINENQPEDGKCE